MTTADQLWCSPGVFMAQVQEDIILLDLNADQYHCLLGAAAAVEIVEGGALKVRDNTTAIELISAGIATSTPQDSRRPLPLMACHEVEGVAPAPSLPTVIRAGAVLFAATLAYRGRSIAQLIDENARPEPPPQAFDASKTQWVASAARAALPWLPLEGECLQRSFQIRRLLRRHGVHADWMFGVRTWPFGAHCWLQVGDRVVADRLERIRRYTPIMAA